MSASDESVKRSLAAPDAGCKGKVSFASFIGANAVLRRRARTKRAGRQVYRCGACGCWHIGTDVFGRKGRQAAAYHEAKHG